MRRTLAPLLLSLVVLAALGARFAQDRATVVVLVRHAEKAGSVGDVPLSEAGHARARALAEALGPTGVDAIVSTQLQRTRSTAEPLAERVGIAVEVVPAESGRTEAHVASTVERVLGTHRGETVVVVGHSNTIPMIARSLGVAEVPQIADAEYDNLWIVVVDPDGGAQIGRAHV